MTCRRIMTSHTMPTLLHVRTAHPRTGVRGGRNQDKGTQGGERQIQSGCAGVAEKVQDACGRCGRGAAPACETGVVGGRVGLGYF